VKINPTKPITEELFVAQKLHNFIMFGDHCRGKSLKQIQDLGAIPHCAASQLTDYEWVAEHLPGIQQIAEFVIAVAQMVDPYRGVNERHDAFQNAACERFSTSSQFHQDPPTGAHSLVQ
jgi:hypothetical protein